ncbi:cobalt transporter [Rheinheimera mesophila]|uniref:Cobalt transporter n=1 Tax=Rheinheimera mesophila TaxID=1547515 RepID=A0A3P3QJJ7_9GAMM|nr:hypothetical protein [Rheinheimera mesophila]RRJ21344.1 cobalt transporter [Rheinheimera mesophila]
MPKPALRLLLLLLIMLNHAVSACDSVVMHLPDEDHPFVVLDNSTHADFPLHQHANTKGSSQEVGPEQTDDHHPSHAHVACYIAEAYSVSADPVVHKASALAQYALITTSYSPAVPPPNRSLLI